MQFVTDNVQSLLQKSIYVTHFFLLFCQIMDVNYFFGIDFTAFAPEPLRSRVSLHWALDLMCEKLMGVSNFPFLVVVSLERSGFQDPLSLSAYSFVCFPDLCWYILPMLLLCECSTEEFCNQRTGSHFMASRARATKPHENEWTPLARVLLKREPDCMLGILSQNDR